MKIINQLKYLKLDNFKSRAKILIAVFSIIGIILIPADSIFSQTVQSGYAPVNGLKMYYEIHGPSQTSGSKSIPLVLVHGGGSTIETTFGKILPSIRKKRAVIAVELQAHGHTADIERPLSFEQDADDLAGLLNYLKVEKADFWGFSNGGNTTLQIGIRHPEIVNKLVVASAMYNRDGLYPWFWDFMISATIEIMPEELKEAFLRIDPNPIHLQVMHDKDRKRMLDFRDWRPEDIRSIEAPTLIMIGDADIVRPEHAVEMFRLLPHSKLLILPGGHGAYIGEITTTKENSVIHSVTVALIEEFLDETETKKE